MNPVFIALFSTRMVGSGIVALAANGSRLFSGSLARQKRRNAIITNLSALPVKWRTGSGVSCGTIPAGSAETPTVITLETDSDFELYNPSQVAAVQVEVCEFFYDVGGAGQVAPFSAPPSSAPSVPGQPSGSTSFSSSSVSQQTSYGGGSYPGSSRER